MKSIVVGVDGSDTAVKAANAAAELASAFGAGLHVVSAVPKKKSAKAGKGVVFTSVDHAEDALADVASRLRTKVPTLTTAIVKGKPAKVLVAEAKRVDADLIVVGNRRMKGAKRLLGAVAEDVAHNAPCDVYIVCTT